MYSVEDLLVSHGYKVSKNSALSYQQSNDGYQHEASDGRTGNGILNGYQTEPEVFATNPNVLAKGFFGDSEKSCVSNRRQINSAGHPRSQQCLEACHATSEAGLSDKPQTERSHWIKTDKDIQYWRRRGQDFSVLLGQTGNGEVENKILSSTEIEGKKRCNMIEKNAKESDSVQNRENARSNVAYENWKPLLDLQKDNIDKCIMKDQKTERTMSDSSGEKLLHDFISYTLADNALGCPNKQKSQSLPKVISPDGLSHGNIPSITGEISLMKEDKTQLHNKYAENLDCNRNSVSKLKYSRPSKPPSYEVHQQTWGAVDVNESQDNQQDNEHLSLPKAQDPSQESCVQDSGLEPPIYVPPPSYKSPPLQHVTNQTFNKVPSGNYYNRPNNPLAKTSTNDNVLTNFLGNDFPFSTAADHKHTDNFKHSVKYIPFDDPRLKHITVTQDTEKQTHNNNLIDAKDSFCVGFKSQESKFQHRERESAFTNLKSARHNYGKREGIKHKQWLHISIQDQICCSLPESRDGSTACSLPENNENSHKLSLKKTHSDSACETVTKVKKFEPEAYMRGKKSSKRKLNETIFCLVSIPVKSDSAPSDMYKNNKDLTDNMDRINMLKHSNGGLHERRLLSVSSSDLELQTLTGNLNNKAELLKQAQSKTEENKQANDLRSVDPRKHRELAYSGSWPGDQYKDQQTQTVFTDTENEKLHNIAKTSELPNKFTKSQCASASGLAEPRLACENARQNVYSIKGQMSLSPSSNSAFSRTSSLLTHISKPEPCQRLEVYNENASEKEKIITEKCEKNDNEAGNNCNKKEVFGQFLLKPVSRRPWDVISELESLNKEFQENCTNDGDRDVVKEQSDGLLMESFATRTAIRKEMVSNRRHVMEIQESQMFESPQMKCKSESRCTEKFVCDKTGTSAELQKPIKIKDSRGKPGKSSEGRVKTEIQVGNYRSGNSTNLHTINTPNMEQKVASVQIQKTKVQTNNHEHAPDANFCHIREDKSCFDHSVNVNLTKIDQVWGKAIRKISLKDRSNRFSVPDLSKHFVITNHNGEFYEQQNDLEIPENESLQERAARILGIDVADDCLVSTESSEAQSPENFTSSSNAQRKRKSREKISEMSCSTKETPEMCGNVLHSPLDTEIVLEKLNLFQGQDQVCQSTSPHSDTNIARTTEKRVRNTSKMIETLQGKLSSTPPRTAVDRLARMKEVDSVSRMRRLSIKSTDSGDEIDEDKQLPKVQDVGSRKFSAGSIYKRVISLDESLLISTKTREKLDFSFADSYDPARVERV
ncbi:junctional cadherin 5-associated protein [Rhinophrynus dorsalis]